ncbi:MAG: ACT domain-containing protein [Deltaproteobacteria bacterium]|nr:MAG: ACT domain-containing protein [Deltaproteobacteria bacterium]
MSLDRISVHLRPEPYGIGRGAAPPSGASPSGLRATITCDGMPSFVAPWEEARSSGALGPYRCLSVRGPLPMDAVGILAALLEPLAHARIPVFVLSDRDTDHVLVPADRAAAARVALEGAGIVVDGPRVAPR